MAYYYCSSALVAADSADSAANPETDSAVAADSAVVVEQNSPLKISHPADSDSSN